MIENGPHLGERFQAASQAQPHAQTLHEARGRVPMTASALRAPRASGPNPLGIPMKAAPTGTTFWLAFNGAFLSADSSWTALTGLSARQAADEGWTACLCPEQFAELDAVFKQFVSSFTPTTVPIRLRTNRDTGAVTPSKLSFRLATDHQAIEAQIELKTYEFQLAPRFRWVAGGDETPEFEFTGETEDYEMAKPRRWYAALIVAIVAAIAALSYLATGTIQAKSDEVPMEEKFHQISQSDLRQQH